MSNLILYLIRSLIVIGDITIYIFLIILYLPKIVISWLISRVNLIFSLGENLGIKIKSNTLSLYRFTKKFLFKSLRNFNKRHIELPHKASIKIEKRKKPKQIQIFPFSSSWIKIRYFVLGFIFSTLFIFLPILFFMFIQELPSPRMLSLRESAQTTKIYDRNGNLLYQIYANQNRTSIPLSNVPKKLQQATIAIEDKDFYLNPGFDVEAIIRSVVSNLSGKPTQGGSTITQQLIKSVLLTPEISISRKFKEIILAFWAEKIYSKNQILEMYLNEIPYGGTAWGIEAASQTYFGKQAKDLDLAQSTFLAGLPNAPTIYSPYGSHPDLWKERQKEVLRKMLEQGYVSKQEARDAEKQELSFRPIQDPLHAPHFVMYVKDLLIKKYGLAMVERGGLTVKTSLDLNTQEISEKIVKDQVNSFSYLNLTNGAALITNPKNGDILAMVGSKDYSNPDGGNYNTTTALRQPGSSIKVITYSTALQKGFTAATSIDDFPITFRSEDGGPSYSPVNYDTRFHGRLTLRQALANSINIPAVKLLNAVGIPSMIDLAKKMGISTWDEPDKYGLAVTLGAAETKMTDMATVYGTLANQGKRVDLNPLLEVRDSSGKTLVKKSDNGEKVMNEGASFIISSILADNQARAMEFGINSPLVIGGKTVSVKTGTSDNKRDNWTIGYTPSYVVAVWVGNNDNSPMNPNLASGITGAAPIWHELMTYLLKDRADEKQSIPSNIVSKLCFGRNEYFIKGTENFANCNFPKIKSTPSP